MSKPAIALCLLWPLAAGCVTNALERHAVNQIQTVSDFRYEASLHCLAMVADNRGTLPSYALLSSGVAAVSDTGLANAATNATFDPSAFKSEVVGLTGTHAPNLTWTVTPVSDYAQLAALRCVCQWVLAGPDRPNPDFIPILASPDCDRSDGPHFGVAWRLKLLRPHWVHVGKSCDIPSCACYKEHLGETWVWVMADGMEGLAEFTLALQDIATLIVEPTDGSTVPADRAPPYIITLWVYQMLPAVIMIEDGKPKKNPTPASVGQNVFWRSNDSKTYTVTVKDSNGTTHDPIQADSTGSAPYFLSISGTHTYTVQDSFTTSAGTIAVGGSGGGKTDSAAPAPATIPFRVDRVVRPECLRAVQSHLNAVQQGAPSDVPWQQWLAWTTPYQGQRTGTKPGVQGTTATTTKPPPGRSTVAPLLGPVVPGIEPPPFTPKN